LTLYCQYTRSKSDTGIIVAKLGLYNQKSQIYYKTRDVDMKINIHSGAHEIGGTCIEISTDQCRILLDAGLPLNKEASPVRNSLKTVDGIIISHSHMDHFGLLDQFPAGIPVYTSKLSKNLIRTTRIFLSQPRLKNKFIHCQAWKTFEIGDLRVTPYPADHSASGAYSYLVENSKSRIFFTGDFKGHGRKKIFRHFIDNPVHNIDVLITEGTMTDRTNDDFPDEDAVEEAMSKELEKSAGISFVCCSSQNIDRIVTAYRAAVAADRYFVIDIYTAWILELMKDVSKNTPRPGWKNFKVLAKDRTAGSQYQKIKENRDYFSEDFIREIYSADTCLDLKQIKEHPEKYLIKTNRFEDLIKRLDSDQVTLIYSMWEGYIEKNKKNWESVLNNERVAFHKIHSSGHAVVEDLKTMIDAVKPKTIIPIHTECREWFDENFDNVRILNDNEILELE